MKMLVSILQFAASTAVVLYVVHNFNVNFYGISIGYHSIGWIVAVLALLAFQLAVNAFRWQTWIVWNVGPRLLLGRLGLIICASNLYSQILPTGLGFDVIRGTLVSRLTGPGVAARSVFLDTTGGLVVLLLTVLALSVPLYGRTGAFWIAATLAASSTAALAALASAVLAAHSGLAFQWGGRLRSALEAIRDVPAVLTSEVAPVTFLCSAVNILASVLLIYLIAQSLDVALALWDCLLIVPCALLVSSLPISFSGWGIREGSMAAGFALVGAKIDQVILVSALYGLTAPLLGLIYYASYLFGLTSINMSDKR